MCDKRKVAVSSVILVVYLFLSSVSGLAQATQGPVVLGNLMAHKSIAIESQGVTINITDTTYAYFGGDRIRTGDESAAALRLGDVGAVYLGPSTVGIVTSDQDQYVIDLEKGGIRFVFEEGVAFQIITADTSVSPETFLKAAEGTAGQVSGVVVIDKGRPVIHALTGTLVARHKASGASHTIKVGEAVALDDRSGNFVKVVLPDEKGVVDDDGAAGWHLSRAGQAFVGLFVGGGVIAVIANGGGNSDADNTSPAE